MPRRPESHSGHRKKKAFVETPVSTHLHNIFLQLSAINDQLKHLNSKAQTAIAVSHATTVEVQELRSETSRAMLVFTALLGDGEERAHAEAAIKDFIWNKNKT